MAKLVSILVLTLISTIIISSIPPTGHAVSYCNDPCQSLDDCDGQLICINSQCNDDPEVGTTVCGGGGGGGGTTSPSTGTCQQLGTVTCQGRSYPTFDCSPPVTSTTPAKLTLNHVSEGGASKCDGKVYSNDELVVALSTGWYDKGSRCLKMLLITAGNGRSVAAKVVDECDSLSGCGEAGHAGQPPCPNNIVDGSRGVWEALGINQDEGIVDIVWSMV